MQVISTWRCGPTCLSACLSVASAFLSTFRSEVTRYLSRCDLPSHCDRVADFDLEQPNKDSDAVGVYPHPPVRAGGISTLAVVMGAELCIAFVILSTTSLLVMVAQHP